MKRYIRSNTASTYTVVLSDGQLYRDDKSDDLIHIKSKPVLKQVNSLEEASQACRDYIDKYNLGSSGFTGGIVLQDNKPVAVVSYNGRVSDFNDFINRWGTGIVENSRVLKSLGYTI